MATAEQPSLDELFTVVRGPTFCVSDRTGVIDPATWQGVYHRDVRVLSLLTVTAAGRRPPLLAAHRDGASAAVFVHVLAATKHGSPTAILTRRREVTAAEVSEHLEVHVFEGELTGLDLAVDLGCDFALLRSSGHDVSARAPMGLEAVGHGQLRAAAGRMAVTVSADAGAVAAADQLRWTVHATPDAAWSASLLIRPTLDGVSGAEAPGAPSPLHVASTDRRWTSATSSALADLDALRVHLPDLNLTYIGAGVPWFMALFGRDTLLAAFSSLVTGPEVALDVLGTLARHQGRQADPVTLEQPGRILHEMRTGGSEVFGVSSGVPYYGSVDASPLFVMLVAEAHRWGAPDDEVSLLLPAGRAALDWCSAHGDPDGDGFVEYIADPKGLRNQGWKDSGDSMVHADGSLAPTPLALAEVQAYHYGALLGMAQLEERLGDPAAAPRLRQRAAALRAAFERDFWLADQGLVAMGLDADKRPLAVAASNMAHCLWTGLLRDEVALAVAHRLGEPDLVTRWGLRTLGIDERAHNPLGYHLGSVWPHDTAIAVAGLMHHGAADVAVELVEGLLDACEAFGGRLPELFAGLDEKVTPFPVAYPVACSPQAWSAAAPLSLLRSVLRLEPDVPAGRVTIAPVLPDDTVITVTGIRLGTAGALDLRVCGRQVEVLSAPPGLHVVTRAT